MYLYYIVDNYQKAFQDAVKKHGSFHAYMAHCLPFGPSGSEKTSLLHRLLGKPLETLATHDKSPRSDDVMVPKYIIATGGEWYEVKDLKGAVSELAASTNPLIQLMPLSMLLQIPVDPVRDDKRKANLIACLRDDNTLDSIKNIDMSKFEKLLHDGTIIIYNDTGSQPEFLELVTPLIGGPVICILMFSLAQGLDSKYTVSCGSSDSEYRLSFTVKEVFMLFLSSIANYHGLLSYGNPLKSRVSPFSVVVVGTQKNLVSEAKVTEIDKELKQAVEATSLHNSGAIEYFSENQLIIPVDNYNKINDSVSVRDVVERIIKKENSPYKIEFPKPWYSLDLALGDLPSIVTYKDCIKIAKKFDISEEDLPSCLWFLHHRTGSIRYYGSVSELKHIVIVRPTVIFRAISELITNTFTRENVPSSQVEKLKNLGLLKRDTLESIFTRHQEKLQMSCDSFIALLNKFSILEPSHDPELGDYFFPCALVRAPIADPPSEVKLDPLLVLFKGGFVPRGVFSRLLVFLLREMEWRIQRRVGLPLLYRDQASFDDGKDCLITLRATAKCLEVSVESKQASDLTSSLYNIRQIIEIGVFNACKSLLYDQSFCTPKFGFYCNLPECARHIAEIDLMNKEIECPLTNRRYPVNTEREYWFITDKPG